MKMNLRTITMAPFLFVLSCKDRNTSIPVEPLITHEEVNNEEEIEKNVTIEEVKHFILDGYEVLHIAKGDLNFDKYDDIILILKEINEPNSPFSADIEFENPSKRPLFILLGTENEGFEVAFRNDNIVYSQMDGGMYGDLYKSVEILPGYFMAKHYEGSVHRWNRKTAFVYEPHKKDWRLFADIEEFSNIERESGIEYFLNKPRLQEEILFSEFNIYSE